MKISYTTELRRNNRKDYFKPNEDYLIINNNTFIIADGVSRDRVKGKYPVPSPAADVAQILCNSVKDCRSHISQGENIKGGLKLCLEKANEEIKKYNINSEFSTFLPGAVAIVAFIENKKLHLSYVGDCFCVLIRNNNLTRLTTFQTELIRQDKKKFTTDFIRERICNNINHPYGYGVFTGQRGVLDFIEYKVIKLERNDRVILASDGLEELLYSNSILLDDFHARKIVDQAESIESIGNNKSDDKAVISLYIETI